MVKKHDIVESTINIAHAYCTSNNTKITVTDSEGKTLVWASGGSVGFKGSKRSTSYAAQATAEIVGEKAYKVGIRNIQVRLKGIGKGRFSVAKGLRSAGLRIQSISDVTPLPHNGCRPPKKRRI
jgi:small subunit ribosomal protein S11|tara:strand:- start:157 stop:528 length:372 start_codon:yes stop_codon:yes gene_type:complete